MAKFYVESGDLQVVVEAERAIPAAARALSWTHEHFKLAPRVSIKRRSNGANEPTPLMELETGTLLSMIGEYDMA